MSRFKTYLQSLQQRPAIVSGHIASVAIDPDTGQQTHAQIAVGANMLRIALDQFAPPLAQGDAVRLAQYGQPASAEYRLAGLEAGGRTNTGLFPIMNDGTVLGGVAYPGGDYIFGKLDEGNIHIEAQTGRLYHRVGLDVYGIEYPNGNQLHGHCAKVGGEWTPDGPNLLLSPTALRLRNGLIDTIRLEAGGTAWLEKGLIVSPSGVIQVGESFGAHIRLGKVTELDSNGAPIVETFDRYAIRAVDGSGVPRIALLTGTPDAPFAPAWLLGSKTDTYYLHYQNGLLELKGRGIFSEGEIGGLVLASGNLTSRNGRFRIITESESGSSYGEGLIMLAGAPEETGVLRWVAEPGSDWNIGLKYVGRDPEFPNTYLSYSHVSTPEGQAGYTKHVWVSGGWGSTNQTLTWDSNGHLGNVRRLNANNITAFETQDDFNADMITLSGRIWDVFIPPAALPTVTNMGSVVAVSDWTNYTEGIHARLLYPTSNGAEIPIALDVRNPLNRLDAQVFIVGLRLLWKKTIQGAYLQTIILGKQTFPTESKTALLTLSNEQYDTAAGSYVTTLVAEGEPPIELSIAPGNQYYLVIKGAFPGSGAATGQLRIMGVEMTLCDGQYKALNHG